MSRPCSEPCLAINACEDRLQLLLWQHGPQGPEQLAAQEWAALGRVGEVMAPAVAGMLRAFDLGVHDLRGVAVARGPGSFTGLRLTLAFAAGLAAGAAGDLPVAGYDYLPLLAAGVPCQDNGSLAVVTYARTGLVYLQPFTGQGQALAPVRAVDLPVARQLLADLPAPVRVLGSGLTRHPDVLEGLEVQRLPLRYDVPSLEALLRVAVSALGHRLPAEPLYARGSDAEDNLSTLATSRGLSPQEADQALAQATTRTIT